MEFNNTNCDLKPMKTITINGRPYKVYYLSTNPLPSTSDKPSPTQEEIKQEDKNYKCEVDDQINKKHQQDNSTQTDSDTKFEKSFNLMKYLLDDEDLVADKEDIVDLDKPEAKHIFRIKFYQDLNNAHTPDSFGNLPIHLSVMENNINHVNRQSMILKAMRDNINIVNSQTQTPLHLAVIHGVNIEILEHLINQGSNLGAADSEGNTVFHLAIEHGQLTQLNYLLNTALLLKFNLDVYNHEGLTPLHQACIQDRIEYLKLLLNFGANPNIGDMKSGKTALFYATEQFKTNMIQILLEKGADFNRKNFYNISARDILFEVDNVPTKIKDMILGTTTEEPKKKQKRKPYVKKEKKSK